MPPAQNRNNNYDILRVIAALCILYTHSFDLLGKNTEETLMVLTDQKINFAYVGLVIFFTVSGYLIAKSADTSSSFKNYIWKRFLRIQPLLIVVSIVSILIIGPFFTTSSLTAYFTNTQTYFYIRNVVPLFGIQFTLPNVFITNIGDAGVNGSMWTLVVEERLYLILGLLFVHKIYFKKILITGILMLNILYFFNSVFSNGQFIPYLSGLHIYYALVFLNGSLFYFIEIPFAKIKFKSFALISISFILYFTSFTIFKNSIQVLLVPFFIIAIAEVKCLTNNAAKYGDITYGLYIFSFPVQQMLISSKVCTSAFGLLYSTLLIVVPLAFLCWHLIEKKLLSLKEKVQ